MGRIEVATFKEAVLAAGILDTDCHSEFVGGNHGLKLHYDRITPGSEAYDLWVKIHAQTISEHFPAGNRVRIILGIADGTNQHALDVADCLGGMYIGVQTEKASKRAVRLTQAARRVIQATEPDMVIEDEDASTHGTVCASVVPELRSITAATITCVTSWQREANLPRLDKLGVIYHGVITHPLESYKPEECENIGLCADGVKLIPHGL